MPLATKEKVIDGRKVSVTTFAALEALTLKSRLLNLAGGALIRSLADGSHNNRDRIELAFSALCANIEPETFQDLILSALKMTRVDGIELDEQGFNLVFSGSLVFMYKVLWFALEVNFADFFELAAVPGTIGKMFQTATSRNTGTPPQSNESISQ